jgi:antagonist of KipI
MSEIHVVAPGLLTTVQDLGREGFGPLGVSPSGAADPIALRIGNRLVGNPEAAAGLEMTLLGGTFVFPEGAVAALTGSDFGATLDAAAVRPWISFEVKPGQTLRLGPTRSGARSYLCVRGGIDVEPFLGSASTHLLSGLGGLDGRALRKGDVLKIGSVEKPDTAATRKLSAKALELLAPRKILRVTPGPQSDWFPDAAQRAFYGATYRVTEEANRMGLRLEGPAILEGAHGQALGNAVGDAHGKAVGDAHGKALGDAHGEARGDASGKARGDASGKVRGEMISEGVSLGAIQIAAGGQPIILFVEQQTTGGYAKIANVISADLSSLGQLRPRDEIRFEPVDFPTAQSLLLAQEKLLASDELIL